MRLRTRHGSRRLRANGGPSQPCPMEDRRRSFHLCPSRSSRRLAIGAVNTPTALILTRKIILTAGTEWRFYMTTHSVMSLPWPAGPSPPAPAAPLFALLPFPVAPAAAAAAASASRPSASRDADAAVLFVPTAAALPPAPPAPPAFDVVALPTFAPEAAPAAGALDAAAARHCSATRIVAVAEWVRDGERE
jgi:hypothetical protein